MGFCLFLFLQTLFVKNIFLESDVGQVLGIQKYNAQEVTCAAMYNRIAGVLVG